MTSYQDGTPEHAVEMAIRNHRRWMDGAIIYETPDGAWGAMPAAHQTDPAFTLGARRVIAQIRDLGDWTGPDHSEIDPENPEPWFVRWMVGQVREADDALDEVPFCDSPDDDDARARGFVERLAALPPDLRAGMGAFVAALDDDSEPDPCAHLRAMTRMLETYARALETNDAIRAWIGPERAAVTLATAYLIRLCAVQVGTLAGEVRDVD